MPTPVFVVNLDRHTERLDRLRNSANAHGVEIQRIPAVDGRSLPPSYDPTLVDVSGFESRNGRTPLPGEVGCYLSHIEALRAALASASEMAVILEDDVLFEPGLQPFLDDLAKVDGWGLVKLVNHRIRGFKPRARTPSGVVLGRCIHGPMGSSAGYVVRKAETQKLIDALLPMQLPYDVALEQGWKTGVNTLIVRDTPVRLQSMGSDIGPYNKKFPFYRRFGTLIFRARDYLSRVTYAMMPAGLS